MRRANPLWFPILASLFLGSGCVHTKSTIPFQEEAFQDRYWALIYVYREENAFQSDRSWGVFLDENGVGRLRQGAYLKVHAAPGTHRLFVGGNASRSGDIHPFGPSLVGYLAEHSQDDKMKPQEFQAKSGEIYYFRCKGPERAFLTRDAAIGVLRTMKYDQGD